MRRELVDMVDGLSAGEARELLDLLRERGVGEPLTCPRCGSASVVRKGHDRGGGQRWMCKRCSRTFNHWTIEACERERRD